MPSLESSCATVKMRHRFGIAFPLQSAEGTALAPSESVLAHNLSYLALWAYHTFTPLQCVPHFRWVRGTPSWLLLGKAFNQSEMHQ